MKNPFYELLKIYFIVIVIFFSCNGVFAQSSLDSMQVLATTASPLVVHYSAFSTIFFLTLGSLMHFYKNWRKMQLSYLEDGLPGAQPSLSYWIKDNGSNILAFAIGTILVNCYKLDMSPQVAFSTGFVGNSVIDWIQKEITTKKNNNNPK